MLTAADARTIEERHLAEPGGVWARIVGLRGFGSASPADATVLTGDGSTYGQLLGGVLDPEIRRIGAELWAGAGEAATADLAVDDPTAVAADLVCGGRVEILVQRLTSAPEALWRSIAEGRPATVVTVCSGTAAGATAVVDDLGVHGADRLEAAGVGHLAGRAGGMVGATARQRTVEAGGERVLLEVVLAVTQLVVVGRGDLAGALVAQSGLLGWAGAAVDEAGAAVDAVGRLGANDALVVLSHDPDIAIPALAAGLTGGVGFVGALGSRNTQANRATRLREAGIAEERIAEIHGPVGLDLGAAGPAETAVAVVAEILLARSARTGRSLRETTGRISA